MARPTDQPPPQAMPVGGKALESIAAMRDGKLSIELDASCADVIAAVQATGKKGEVVLKLVFEPVPKGEPHMMFVSDTVTIKIPKLARSATMFYATEEGGLTRRDPRQPELSMEPGQVTRPKALAAVVPLERSNAADGE